MVYYANLEEFLLCWDLFGGEGLPSWWRVELENRYVLIVLYLLFPAISVIQRILLPFSMLVFTKLVILISYTNLE